MTDRWTKLDGVEYDPADAVERLLLGEYGAVFAAVGVTPPTKVAFRDQAEVERFQADLDIAGAELGRFLIELQRPALIALLKAGNHARDEGLTITPRGADSARRSFNETVELWKSRVEPALAHWTGLGKLTDEEAESVRRMPIYEQVRAVLGLEQKGLWFAKDLSKSIIYSVAPPGTSQHLSLLAFDAAEHADARVCKVLADNGWFQTVTSDLPHFTYLGARETDLPGLGLKSVEHGGRRFWVPDF